MDYTVREFEIKNGKLRARFTNVGASITHLFVQDQAGEWRDILLAHETAQSYLDNVGSLGAVIGRYADRILGGSICVNGVEYPLVKNDAGKHTIHGGGKQGFSHKIWDAEQVTNDSITFHLFSPHLDAGFPGNMDVRVTYTLEDNALNLTYDASADRDTYVSLTNHAYFNLNGHDTGDVLGHILQLASDAFLPCDKEQILTGELLSVENTPNDFRWEKRIGQDLHADFDQFDYAGRGYDTAFCLQDSGELMPIATVRGEKSGITMDVSTTCPLVLFYTANHMDGSRAYKENCFYEKYAGFCLETQLYVDAMHFDNFPDSLLKAGDKYHHVTRFAFDVNP